jgi:uncharacterized membrane protein YphA (DoxX/SURF4 family)
MFLTISIVLAVACVLPAAGKLLGSTKMRQSATRFEIPWRKHQSIALAEIVAAAGVVIGLRWLAVGLVGAIGMFVLLLGALRYHRKAKDDAKEMSPALAALAITIAYLAVAIAR